MPNTSEPETLRARLERAMAGPPRITVADVQRQASKGADDLLSYTLCSAICRGSEQQGEKANAVRRAVSTLTNVPFETLFAGLVITVTTERTVGEPE